MKKGLVLGLIGLGSLFALVGSVKAETLDLTNVSTTGQTVTVGEVDAPVYSVDITWGDLTYDYEYNQNTEEYYWRPKKECIKLTNYNYLKDDYEDKKLDLYWDAACKREMNYNQDFDTALEYEAYYSTNTESGTIAIVDNSTNARIRPSLAWTSETDYDFVIGKFYYEAPVIVACDPILTQEEFDIIYGYANPIYTDADCSIETTEEGLVYEEGKYYYAAAGATDFKELTGSTLPEEARLEGAGNGLTIGNYYLRLSLENNPAKEANMPVKGDKIGTVTINIDAA